MSKQQLSTATQIYYGAGYDAPVYGANGRKGVPVCQLTRVSLGSPAAGDDDLLIDDATSTELPNNSTKTYTPANNGTSPCDNGSIPASASITTSTGASATVWTLDAPRNLVFGTTVAAADTVFTITGHDTYKVKMVEAITIASGDSAGAGKMARSPPNPPRRRWRWPRIRGTGSASRSRRFRRGAVRCAWSKRGDDPWPLRCWR